MLHVESKLLSTYKTERWECCEDESVCYNKERLVTVVFVKVLDHAERLREMEATVLPAMLRLAELVSPSSTAVYLMHIRR